MPVLDVADMERSVAFYRDKLGFNASMWGDPAGFTIVQRGTVTLALCLNPQTSGSQNAYWSAYIYVHDVDAVHDEFVARNIMIHRPPENTHYGCRDFDVKDPDRHIIAFGTPNRIGENDLGPGLGPDRTQDAITPENANDT